MKPLNTNTQKHFKLPADQALDAELFTILAPFTPQTPQFTPKKPDLGMLPLMRTVLNRDYSTAYESLHELRTVSIRGTIPTKNHPEKPPKEPSRPPTPCRLAERPRVPTPPPFGAISSSLIFCFLLFWVGGVRGVRFSGFRV